MNLKYFRAKQKNAKVFNPVRSDISVYNIIKNILAPLVAA
jgi:hypothetical protein